MNKPLAGLALTAALAVSFLGTGALAAEPEQTAATSFASAVLAAAEQEQAAADAQQAAEAAAQAAAAQAAAEQQAAAAETTPPAAEAPSADSTAAAHSFTYVALGDSITAGNGLPDFQYAPAQYGVDASPNFLNYSPDCFVAKAADQLGLDRQHAVNLGLPALMSIDMLQLLQDGKMPGMNFLSGMYYDYPQYREYVANADVITLQIGANDALVPFVVSIWNATDQKSEQFANSLLAGFFRDMSSESFQLLKESLSKLKLTSEERAALNYALTDGMAESCEQGYVTVTQNLPQIVAAIRQLNPDVDIVLMGNYNPAWMLSPWRSFFSRLNAFEKQFAADNGLTFVSVSWTPTSADLHPTLYGHKRIGKKLANAIAAQPSYQRYAASLAA